MKFTSNKGELTLNKTPNITLARFDSETYRKWNRILASISCILIFLLLLGIVLRSIWNERHENVNCTNTFTLELTNYGESNKCRLSFSEQNQKCIIECSNLRNFIDLNLLLANSESQMEDCKLKIIIKNSNKLEIKKDWIPNENHDLTLQEIEFNACDINIIDTTSFDGILFDSLQILTFQTTNIKLIKAKSLKTHRLEQLNFRDTHLETIEQAYALEFESLHTLQYVKFLNNPIILENLSMYTRYPQLTTLDLRFSDNLILKKEMFAKLKGLQLLFLNDGSIISIGPEAFAENNKLVAINLSNTELSYIPENIFGNYPNMDKFDISRNKWFCNCSLEWLKDTWLKYGDEANSIPICDKPDHFHGLTFEEVNFCSGEIETTPTPITTISTPNTSTTISTSTTDNNEIIPDEEILTMLCLNDGEIHIGDDKFSSTIQKNNYKRREIIDFNVFELNGDVIVELNETLDDYCVLWINNHRDLIIDDNSVIYDKSDNAGCFTKINQTTNIMKLIPENLYTICLIHENGTLVSPFECKAIKISFFNEWISNKSIMLWVIIITVTTVILLILIGFIVYKKKCSVHKRQTRQTDNLNQIIHHDDAFNTHVQWPFPTHNIDTISHALNKSTTFSIPRSQTKDKRRLERSLSESSFYSYRTFQSGETSNYVKPPEPSPLELLNWKMTCLREKYFKEQASSSPPPLPPYPEQKSTTNLSRSQHHNHHGTSFSSYTYH